MYEVPVRPLSLDALREVLSAKQVARLDSAVVRGQRLLAGRVVWNVSSTSSGGGVAEMLHTLLGYVAAAGVQTRWLIVQGDPEFFAITKRLHNALHGAGAPTETIGPAEHQHYERVLAPNVGRLRDLVRPSDLMLLHDPQPAGLLPAIKAIGTPTVWRCHIGADTPTDRTELAWRFVRRYVEQADAFVFSRAQYAPGWTDSGRVAAIPPSIDPMSLKNRMLSAAEVQQVLRRAGMLAGGVEGPVQYRRVDGSVGEVRAHRDILLTGPPPGAGDRLVVQISRWDRLKDMAGVMAGFVAGQPMPEDVQLMLVGPTTAAVSDDPEGADVLAECLQAWQRLPGQMQRRVHLASVPMDDPQENALIVNATQRHAAVVVQKSLAEGFGLTVAEAMWKGRPVLGSAVGGIRDQIEDGQSGVLIGDPHDLRAFGAAVRGLVTDPARAERLGRAGQERVREGYLGDRHLAQYVDLFERLLR